jgi:hypothetical protein
MNIAARFPIKAWPELFYAGVGIHIVAIFISLFGLSSAYLSVISLCVTIYSFWLSYHQYISVTQCKSDLCWTGENWVISDTTQTSEIIYLSLQNTSWLTEGFCLLKFACDNQQFAWLFTKKHLGDRAYRELCYMVNRDFSLSRRKSN